MLSGIAHDPIQRDIFTPLFFGAELHVPEHALCTDNAAMIASAGRYLAPLPYPQYLGLDVFATGEPAPRVAA